MTQKMNNTATICQISYMPDYQVKEVMEENYSINDEDIIEGFKAEDGAEWYGYVEESFTLSAEDIKDAVRDAGYDADKLGEMSREEKYRMVMGLVDEDVLCDPDNYSTITECRKDYNCDIIEMEENEDGDLEIYIEVKFKFTLDGNEVKKQLVKRITLEDAPWVLNFPTKYHWKYPSKMEYIEKGLQKFVDTYKEKGITSIAFPMLGTNNGGLDKVEVQQLMERYLSQCDIPIEIYEYDPEASDDLFEKFNSKWNAIPSAGKKAVTGIRTEKQIETIDNAVNSDSVRSMIALIEYQGIGLKTMEKCFQLVMKTKLERTLFG